MKHEFIKRRKERKTEANEGMKEKNVDKMA